MRLTKYVISFLFFAFQFGSLAHAVTKAECNDFSSNLNKEFPLRIDKHASVLNTMCVGANPIYLVYSVRVEDSSLKFSASQLNSIRQFQINTWCTTPSQVQLLRLLGIKYEYKDRSGRYLGETSFTIKDCR